MIEGYYPPRDKKGYLVKNLNEIPKGSEILDQNEYYRLYQNNKKYYIYKIKNPQSPLMGLLSKSL